MFDYFYNFHSLPLGNKVFSSTDSFGEPPTPPGTDALLQENGDFLLQENGDKILI